MRKFLRAYGLGPDAERKLEVEVICVLERHLDPWIRNSGRANCVGTNLACLTNRTSLCNLYPSNSIQVVLLLTTELEKNCKQMSKLSIKEGRISFS